MRFLIRFIKGLYKEIRLFEITHLIGLSIYYKKYLHKDDII